MPGSSARQFFSRYSAAALLVPMLVVVGILVANAVVPFGENLLVPFDMFHQYLPIMAEIQRKLHTGASLFYTWNGGGGMNFVPVLAYQGASPLALFLLWVFPESMLSECVMLLLVLRVGLAGFAMHCFLQGECALRGAPGAPRANVLRVVLACCYALCGYTIAYYWNIMWLTGVVLLPLVALGLKRLVEGQGVLLYTLTLALLVFSNYYIGAMVCLFLVLYFLVVYFEHPREGGARAFGRTAARFAGYSLVAGGLAAVVLVPTFMGIRSAEGFLSAAPAALFSLQVNPLAVLGQLLPNSVFTTLEGPPNVYCGLVSLLLLGVYAASAHIARREKVANGILVLVLLVSMAVPALDYVWNLFHIPNQIPFRYSFVLCFLLVSLASRAADHLENTTTRTIAGIAVVGVVLFGIAYVVLGDALENPTTFLVIGLLLWAMFLAVLVMWRIGWAALQPAMNMLAAVAMLELVVVSYTGITTIGHTPREVYWGEAAAISQQVEAAATDADGRFSRIDATEADNKNAPFTCGYRGITAFTSSVPANHAVFLEQVGLAKGVTYHHIQFMYQDAGPVANAIMNVNYTMVPAVGAEVGVGGPAGETPAEGAQSSFTLVKSSTPVSIAYVVPESILEWNAHTGTPEEVQDGFVRAVSAGAYTSRNSWDAAYQQLAGQMLTVDEWGDNFLHGTVSAAADGILYTSIFADEGWVVTVDGAQVQPTAPVGGALLAVPITAGEHQVEFYFQPPGLFAGEIASVAAALLLVVLRLYAKQRSNNHGRSGNK